MGSRPQSNKYAEIIDVDSEPSTATQNRYYNQPVLQKTNSQYSNSSQGNYNANLLFMQRMGKDTSSSNFYAQNLNSKNDESILNKYRSSVVPPPQPLPKP